MMLILFSIIIKIYFFLNCFQKNYYEFKSILKLVAKKYYVIYVSSVFIILKHFINNIVIDLFIVLTLLLQVIYLIKKSKVFLKFTKRIIRLFVTVLIQILLLSLFLPCYIIEIITPLIIILANLINHPLELLISNFYIKKAIKKINKVNAIKIAITGSYGKTSTKNYITNVLKNKYIVHSTPKSYNTPLGISLFINKSKFNCTDFVIYEFGARRKGDILELQKYYPYDIAIITGIGKMHIDTFKTMDNIIEEKMSLAKKLTFDKIAILNYENEFIRANPISCIKYTYGFNNGQYQARNLKLSIFQSEFDLYIKDKFIRRFIVKPLGRGAILNILPAIILCDLYKINYDFVSNVMAVDNRLTLRKMEGYYILDDAYNSNILGVNYALEVLGTHQGKKYLITPGFAEMKLIEDELLTKYSDNINEIVDSVILVKNEFTIKLSKYIKNKEIIFQESFKEAFDFYIKNKEDSSIVLIENDLLE